MTSLRIMRDRDHEQDIQHALNELDHLTRWGMSREHALAKVGLTETLIEKREWRARTSTRPAA